MHINDLLPWGPQRRRTPRRHDDTDAALPSLQRDMRSLFEDFLQRMGGATPAMTTPRTDIAETDEAVEVAVDLPGMDEDDIDVSVTGETLVIRGEKRDEHKEERRGYYLAERSYGSVYRSLPLPPGVDPDKAEAKFKRGVLTIRLPKTEDARARAHTITVKGE